MAPSVEAQADSLVTLLEGFQPRSALKAHLGRLEAIVRDVRNSAAVAPSHDVKQQQQIVWDNENLVARILAFEGSLAYYDKNYDAIVGYTNPLPFDSPQRDYQQRTGNPSLAFVNKLFCSLIVGTQGPAAWRVTVQEPRLMIKKQIAVETKDDPSLTLLPRLYAMALADDEQGLKRVFLDQSALDAAVSQEYLDEDCCWSLVLPDGHKFHGQALTHFIEESQKEDFVVELAYNAALVGSHKALQFLMEQDNDLAGRYFDQKSGGLFLSRFVEHACFEPAPHHAQSIRILLQYGLPQDAYFGSVGHSLHIAAARGAYELVAALLESGFDPSIKCEQHSMIRDERARGIKQYSLPQDWASLRGHDEVVQLLQERREQLRPNLSSRFCGAPYFSGKLFRFFPQQNRRYGFISPDTNQLELADCSDIFIHHSVLQQGAKQDDFDDGYPIPGQRLLFSLTTDRQGRKRANMAISGEDCSYIRLVPSTAHDAERAWENYYNNYMYGDDDDDDDEDSDDDHDDYYPGWYGELPQVAGTSRHI